MNLLLVVLITLFGGCVSRDIIGNCIYEYQDIAYMCRFSAEPVKLEDDVIAINGTHIPGFNDDSVTFIDVQIDSIMAVTPIIFCKKFKNVRNIIVSRVQLSKVTENSFSECLNLEFIYLSINQMNEFAPNAFRNNVRLDRVNLDRNSLYEINAATFRGLTNLRELNLRGNFITEIPPNAFSDLVNIEELTLFSNRITRIHPDFLDSLPASQTVTINLFDNVCISQFITLTRETIDQLRPLFNECFNNYRQHYGLF